MKLIGFSHVTINVTEMSNALRFYIDILGMRLVWHGERDAYVTGGMAWVCLQERPENSTQAQPIGVDHVAFLIDEEDFMAAVNALKEASVPIVRGPMQRGSGWSVNFLDPDGTQLELHTSTLDARMKVW